MKTIDYIIFCYENFIIINTINERSKINLINQLCPAQVSVSLILFNLFMFLELLNVQQNEGLIVKLIISKLFDT